MIKRRVYNNPKALNLEILKGITNKVTLGFKCSPELKLKLADGASDKGLTLSNYTEMILLDFDEIITEKVFELELLNNKINFYESNELKALFNKHRGKTVKYKNSNNEMVNQKINCIEDVYIVIINSFK